MLERWGWLFLFSLLVFSFAFHSAQTSWQQDLGRHLKIGQIILETKQIPRTNLFSYTHPDFPFQNHHWLGEVFFYLIYSYFANAGLVIFKTIIFLLTIGGLFWFFWAKKGNGAVALLALGPLLVLRQRTQIRPELFGYLFFSLYLIVFQLAKKDRRWLYLLPILQIIWTNCHLSFVFGVFLLGLELIKSLNRPKTRAVLIGGILATLANPFFIRGVLKPVLIWQNYGYRIAENQSIFFLSNLGRYPNITIYKISLVLILATFVLARRWRSWDCLGWLILSAVAAWQIRHFPFWAFYSLYCLGKNNKMIKKKYSVWLGRLNFPVTFLTVGLIVTISGLYLSGYYYRIHDYDRRVSAGGAQPARKAAVFLQNNFPHAHIFNNFDIGSYLDWAIYPTIKVFADSRPEAFPADFWERYRTAQLDWSEWQKLQQKHDIQVVFFSPSDQTQWGRTFLKNLYQKPSWHLAYWDKAAVIFTSDRQESPDLEQRIQTENDPAQLVVLGEFLQTVGQKELARQVWQKLVKLNPVSQRANSQLISHYQASDNSIRYYQAEKMKKRLAPIWYKL